MFEKDEFQWVIRAAIQRPETADVWALWDAMVSGVQGLDTRIQLGLVGEGYLSIVKVVERRAAVFLVRPELEGQEPLMPEDAFSPFVRQYMDVSFDQFVEGLDRKEHDYPDSRVIFLGDKAGEMDEWVEGIVEGSSIEEWNVEGLEHDEDVKGWSDVVREWVRQQGRAVSIGEVTDATNLSVSRVWIAGLLNYFEFEKKNDFYSPDRLILSVEAIVQDEVA
jgi:hypothetical protein